MAKGTVIRGTPVNFISATNGQGHLPPRAVPPRSDGTTTLPQYKGDQSQKIDPRSGTPLQSKSVNDDLQRTMSDYRYGVSPGAGGQDYNHHAANGNGVVFSGVARSRDNIPTPADVMDSPVPKGAQRPDTDSQAKLNALRNGIGKDYGAADTIPDHFNGVMARDEGN